MISFRVWAHHCLRVCTQSSLQAGKGSFFFFTVLRLINVHVQQITTDKIIDILSHEICFNWYFYFYVLFAFKRWETPSSRHSVVLLWNPIRKVLGPSRSRSPLLTHESPETLSPVCLSAATAGNGTVRTRSRSCTLQRNQSLCYPNNLHTHTQGEKSSLVFYPVHISQFHSTHFLSAISHPSSQHRYLTDGLMSHLYLLPSLSASMTS